MPDRVLNKYCFTVSLFHLLHPPIGEWSMVMFVCLSATIISLEIHMQSLPHFLHVTYDHDCMPSVLWCCWLGNIWPVKTEWWGAGVVACLEWGADLHMAQLMPLPLTVSCFSKIQIGFTFLVPADPGSRRKRAVKRVTCVCVYLWPWLGPSLVASRYIMYFQFCGWRHTCI